MPKIAQLIAVTTALFSLLAAQAGAVDHRSPDAVDAGIRAQEIRYLEAKAYRDLEASQDHRSPDALDAANSVQRGESLPTYTTTQGPTSSSDDDFEWSFVGLGIVAALCIGGTVVAARRHRRRQAPGRLVGAGS